MTKKDRVKDIIEYLRHIEREYRERDVLYDNDKLGGAVYLMEMVQRGDIKMNMALQILPAIQNPYSEYTLEMVDLKL